jgi:hypothetical protein
MGREKKMKNQVWIARLQLGLCKEKWVLPTSQVPTGTAPKPFDTTYRPAGRRYNFKIFDIVGSIGKIPFKKVDFRQTPNQHYRLKSFKRFLLVNQLCLCHLRSCGGGNHVLGRRKSWKTHSILFSFSKQKWIGFCVWNNLFVEKPIAAIYEK